MLQKAAIILAFIILASALLGTSVLTRGHYWGDDFAAYIMQAKSILAKNMDEFVTANAFTVTHSSHQIGPAAYPWGYPLMLVPVYALIGLSPLALKLPGVLTFLCFLLVFFYLTRRCFTLTESLLATSLFAFNPELLHFLDEVISDIPFLFLSTLAILMADIYAHTTQTKRRRILAIMTGIAIFLAFFVRTQGLILLGAMLLYQGISFLAQKEQRHHLVTDSLIILAAFGMLWGISTLLFPGGQTSYLALYAGFSMDILKSNIISYSRLFGDFFATLPGQEIFLWIFLVFFLVGLIARLKADLLYVLYAVLYLMVLWTWPEWQGYRFIIPMLPFFVYFSMQGIKITLSKVNKTQKDFLQKGTYAFLFIVVLLFAYNASVNAYTNIRDNREINGPFDRYSIETYDYIKNNTPPDSVIVFFKPRAMRLMTNRNSLALTECERIPEGDYLVLSKKVGENLQIPPERIGECNLLLDKEYENRRFLVYRLMD